jgi:predicted nucleic acid-binding protein
MIIVSDTSPISNLLKIDRITLLKEIYQSVIVSEPITEE